MHYLKGVRMATSSLQSLTVVRTDRSNPVVAAPGIPVEQVRDVVVRLREAEGLPKGQVMVTPTTSQSDDSPSGN